MDWFLYDRNLRHERTNPMIRIRKIAEHGWFDVACIDCIDLPYLEENLKKEGERLVNKNLARHFSQF